MNSSSEFQKDINNREILLFSFKNYGHNQYYNYFNVKIQMELLQKIIVVHQQEKVKSKIETFKKTRISNNLPYEKINSLVTKKNKRSI